MGSQVYNSTFSADSEDWRRPLGFALVRLDWDADYTRYTAFQDVEPYANGFEAIEFGSLNGDSFLARRFGPGTTDFDISAACWTPKRTPDKCCAGIGSDRCRLPEAYVHRCCSSFETRGVETKWFQAYIMFSKDLSWGDRLLWDAALPKTRIDELAFQAKRQRWRVGNQEPWDLCPSTVLLEGHGTNEIIHYSESNAAVVSLVEVLATARSLSGSFVNIGAGTCGEGDPLHRLLHSAYGKGFAGLLIDANISDLALCPHNLEDHTASWYRLLHMDVEAKTVAAKLSPHLTDLFYGIDVTSKKWPLDILVIDIDSYDCIVAEEMLQVVEPKILVIELLFHFPPPFRFSAQHDAAHSAYWLANFDVRLFNPAGGCSLSHALHRFKPYGMYLLRLVDQDAIFVHESVAPIFAKSFGVRFPQDEFLCYRQSRLQVQLPMHFVREWFFAEHPADSLANIWRNVTQFQRRQGRSDTPFTLDY